MTSYNYTAETEPRRQRMARNKGKRAKAGNEEKARWKATFADDPIDLQHLPQKSLVLRARAILEAVSNGAPWHQFNGKRLRHDRDVVSVPLGRRYRILFRTDDGSPQPVSVMSHESYNGTKPGNR
ncbi:hypothetical protein PPSIR1_34687 [Plesiocystis pacifica SIR-1]|uniref:ParE-like toxin domain-containing protein n=2 Tax=Plesiocystis pacifica TaxID=191768 RepID=A6GE78_9BACT|nr:hypothetical protein PPSIR1_34687 [Plesiocystis pacifica SIR-1]